MCKAQNAGMKVAGKPLNKAEEMYVTVIADDGHDQEMQENPETMSVASEEAQSESDEYVNYEVICSG